MHQIPIRLLFYKCFVRKILRKLTTRRLILSVFWSPPLLCSLGISERILSFLIFQSFSNFSLIFPVFFETVRRKIRYMNDMKWGVDIHSNLCMILFCEVNEFQWFISSQPCLCDYISWDGLNWPETNVSRVKN